MDGQLKRGLLDVCVLAAIKSEDSYGYKIIKDMKPYIELSESTLYTILKLSLIHISYRYIMYGKLPLFGAVFLIS